MSLKRLVIPLCDIKFTHFEDVAVLSEMQNNKLFQPDVEETKIKITGKKPNEARDVKRWKAPTRRAKSDNSEDPKAARNVKGKKCPVKRTKYNKIESGEDSSYDENAEYSDSSEESNAARYVKQQIRPNKRTKYDSRKELKAARSLRRKKSLVQRTKYIEYNSDRDSTADEVTEASEEISAEEDSDDEENTTNGNSEVPNASRNVKEKKSPVKRTKYNKIESDEDSSFDEDAKHSDNRKEPKAVRRQKCPVQRTKYVEYNSDEDCTFDEVTKSSDNKESKAGIGGERLKRSTRKPKYEVNYEESSDDEESTNSDVNYEEESSDDEKSTNSEMSSSQDSGDSSWSEVESKTSPKRVKGSSNGIAKKPKKGLLSEYEKMVEKNRAERDAFLKSIKIDEAKKDLLKIVDKVKIKKKKVKVRRYIVDLKTLPPVQRPSRSLNIKNYSESALYDRAMQEVSEQKVMPSKMSFTEALGNKNLDLYGDYLQDIKIQESNDSKVVYYDQSVLEKLGSNDPKIGFSGTKQKGGVSHGAMTALAWYPCPENLILAAGCSFGTLSFWNIDGKSNPYRFKNHRKSITHLQFNPFDHNQIVSSSYDGSVYTGDMVNTVFNQVYVIPEETSCQHFDFLSASSYLVAQSDGQVAIVDIRTNGKKSVKLHPCYDICMKTVSMHPVNKTFFVTANTTGCIRMWDLRNLQEQPVANIKEDYCKYKKEWSAFFSPVTGNYILVSSNDKFSLYDSKSLSANVWLRNIKEHKHFRSPTNICRANWLPNSEQAFYISSTAEPQGIVMYDTNFNIFHTICYKDCQNPPHSCVFHPFRPALAVKYMPWKVLVFS